MTLRARGRLVVTLGMVWMGSGQASQAARRAASSDQPPASAAAATAAAPSVLAVEGNLTAVYPYAKPPRLLLTASDGKTLMLTVDPAQVVITKSKTQATWDELKRAEQIAVRYIEKNGEGWATAIDIKPVQSPPTNQATTSAETAETEQPAAPKLKSAVHSTNTTRSVSTAVPAKPQNAVPAPSVESGATSD